MDGRKLGFERDLRWLQDKLGAVRDWDVLRKDALGPAHDLADRHDLESVDAACADARDDAYEALCAALDSRRCTTLWLEMRDVRH